MDCCNENLLVELVPVLDSLSLPSRCLLVHVQINVALHRRNAKLTTLTMIGILVILLNVRQVTVD